MLFRKLDFTFSRKALEKLAPVGLTVQSFKAEDVRTGISFNRSSLSRRVGNIAQIHCVC